MKYWSRPHIDHVYFVTSRFFDNQMIHGVVYFNLLNNKCYSESMICDKVQIGMMCRDKVSDRVLIVSDDTHVYKYITSLELHQGFVNNKGVIFISKSLKKDKYIEKAFEVIKNKASKSEFPFNNGALETSIPHIDNWLYINSKDLVGESR